MQKFSYMYLGGFMILISLAFFFVSIFIPKQNVLDVSEGSFFPTIVSFIMLLCGIVTLTKEYKSFRKISYKEKADNYREENNKTVIYFMIIFLIYILLLYFFPFFIISFLFLVFTMYFLKNISWKLNIIVSISTVLFIYLIFSSVFKIVFP